MFKLILALTQVKEVLPCLPPAIKSVALCIRFPALDVAIPAFLVVVPDDVNVLVEVKFNLEAIVGSFGIGFILVVEAEAFVFSPLVPPSTASTEMPSLQEVNVKLCRLTRKFRQHHSGLAMLEHFLPFGFTGPSTDTDVIKLYHD